MSTVTAIIPVRNGAELLSEALRSLLDQSCPPDEIIVVDDDSDDDTVEVARRTAPSAVVLHADGRGPAAARNRGLGAARGDMIGFLDHDDLWTPHKMARQRALLQSAPDSHVALGLTQVSVRLPDGRFEFSGQPFPALSLGAALFRRDVFHLVGTLDENRRFGDDVAWFALARARGIRIARDAETAQIYRRHASNLTRDTAADRRGFFDALRGAVRARESSS